jgi:heme a synthase
MSALMNRFRKLTFALYIYTIAIILWGAWVRISKSGDGCGDSWPLCDGQILPSTQNLATMIEFSHRLTTGLFGLLVIAVLIYVFKKYKDDRLLKRIALLSFIFTITEALLGAALVKFGLVTDNDSFARLFVMGLHQVNSLLLSGFIGLLFVIPRNQPPIAWSKISSTISLLFLILAATGAIASLSTTLYPSDSLIEGLRADLTGDSHWIVKWRSIHPLLALILGGGLFYTLLLQGTKSGFTAELKDLLRLFAFGLVFGFLTLVFLSPMWMKLTHLTLAHLLWLLLLRYLVNVVSKLSADSGWVR